MPNSEKFLPCHECGSTITNYEETHCECGAVVYRDAIHPNRLKVEHLVPASELEALVKVLDDYNMEHATACHAHVATNHFNDALCDCIVLQINLALAHAREILKGGKG